MKNSFIEEISEFRKILCICPCCGEITRVSDLHLKVKKPIVKTWYDTYEAKVLALTKKEEKFNEKESKIRQLAIEKGRKEAQEMVNNAILPIFRKLKINPFDVKPILNPIDFLVLDGMTDEEKVKNIIFLSKRSKFDSLNTIRKQIKEVIENNGCKWQVARIDGNGTISFDEPSSKGKEKAPVPILKS